MKDYKRIIQGVVNIINTTEKSDVGFVNICAYIGKNCPELKESEDERIRKELIKYLSEGREYLSLIPYNKEECVAWLEKQGEKDKLIQELGEYKVKYTQEVIEQHLNSMNKDNERLRKTTIAFLKDFADKGYENAVECIDWLEKQGKPKSADKVEPKFKVGDWITNGHATCQITFIDSRYWYSETCVLGNVIDIDKTFHLWTIEDAKDGDVLSDGTTIFIFKDLLSDGSVMSYCDYDTDSGESDAFCPLSVNLVCSKITPATKEQRNLLFQKTHEAGYEWDSEKRKLKKIAQKSKRIMAAEAKEALYDKNE